jgi:hypothetical protein
MRHALDNQPCSVARIVRYKASVTGGRPYQGRLDGIGNVDHFTFTIVLATVIEYFPISCICLSWAHVALL